ncbi:recombinase zinc beta ribbon domain-containing protein [Cryptosporangium minutisporangium]|uniref:recombinase zinc beta ribbon domain-containing protein n=1 Tax=Cryptosporangium minutisporangium TaxID=113569 RepID=UPI0035EED1E0
MPASWPTPATPAARSGTARPPTTPPGHGQRRRNDRADWVVSRKAAHKPLVSEAEFLAVQNIAASPGPARDTRRRYLLTGLVRCQVCGRRMEPYWAHHRAAYRCRHGRTSAWPAGDRPIAVYQREDHILAAIRPHGGDAEPKQLAQRVRDAGMVIICSPGRVVLRP